MQISLAYIYTYADIYNIFSAHILLFIKACKNIHNSPVLLIGSLHLDASNFYVQFSRSNKF